MDAVVEELLNSIEPSVRYKVRIGILGEDDNAPAIAALQTAIRSSLRVRQLLANQRRDGQIEPLSHVYKKWTGAHWVLATLADIGYPAGDVSLRPAVDQVLRCWLHPEAIREWACDEAPPAHRRPGVPIVQGRARRCASQQGNALFSAITLGFADERIHELAECLMRWQWPDGGWNCDRKPDAIHSSFWESHIPIRGLSAYARLTGDARARAAVTRAAELFLKRHLYRRQRDGKVMNPQFVRLHYPCYWRYDILFGLKIMMEAGLILDPRCGDALDLLESKRLPNGGWLAEERFYRTSAQAPSGTELVRWGPVGKTRMNEWVTADALSVLRAAGRLR